jgi:hypothetical protein
VIDKPALSGSSWSWHVIQFKKLQRHVKYGS